MAAFKTNIRFYAAPALAVLFSFLSFVIEAEEIKPVRVEKIRHWSGPNNTRVVIELDRKAEWASRLLKKDPSINKPERLYIDIKGAKLVSGVGELSINDGLLKMVRAGQHDKETVRVVLDIDSIHEYKIFPLPNPYRLVIDVMGKGAKAASASSAALPAVPKTEGMMPTGEGIMPKEETKEDKKALAVKTIVLDAGHGGKDPGAIGKGGLEEKDVTLKIVRLLKNELSKELDAKLILSRDSDVFVPLDGRTALANNREADLFISVHVNASPKRQASGVETYYLGSTDDKNSMRVASRENAATKEEMDDTLKYILQDLLKSGNQKESITLASSIQENLSSTLTNGYDGIKDNGVKGALFYVLVNCNMPSVLVEVSFISNPEEEKRMRTDKYLENIAKGISAGVVKYINGGGKLKVSRKTDI